MLALLMTCACPVLFEGVLWLNFPRSKHGKIHLGWEYGEQGDMGRGYKKGDVFWGDLLMQRSLTPSCEPPPNAATL